MDSKQTSDRAFSRREILKYGLYGGAAAALTGSGWLGGCGRRRGRKRPSIIFITVDTLRADRLSCYSNTKDTSVNIDRFAADGVLFENCLSHAPVTSSSFASIMSGFLPHETKVFENLPLPAGIEVLPEILQRQGYITAAVVSNFNLRAKTGWSRGFMMYDDRMEDYEQVRHIAERTAEHTTDRAIELLKELPKDQLFLWVHYNDPHGPYTPPERFAKMFRKPSQRPHHLTVNTSQSGYGGIPSYQRLGTNTDFYYYVSQYDGEIRYQDEQFRRLLDTLKQLDLYDEALIIFSSDHGEGMGEHNYYFAHGENLYSSQTHVPLIIKYGRQMRGKRKDFVQHIDIVPTILKIIGLKPDSRFRGRDLRKEQKTNREIFAAMESPIVEDGVKFSVVVDGLKLIYTPIYKQYELFDLNSDPYEEQNLIEDDKYQKQAEDLKIRLNRIRGEDFLKLDTVSKPQELTDEEREKLKSLGYVR